MTTPNEDLILKLRGQAYTTHRPDQLCDQAADLLQVQQELLSSQAERINTLGAAYRESLDEVSQRNYELRKENDTLRSQLDAIDATEPVAWLFTDIQSGDQEADTDPDSYTREVATGYKHKQPLFTRPMPAQDVTELVELLEFMWRDVSMNDYAFEKLEAALAKYKGTK